MRRTIAIAIGILCVASAALAQCPAITATVTTSGNTVTYNYRLTNTTSHEIWQFTVYMPSGAVDTIMSHTTSQSGWDTLIRKTAFDAISWDRHGAGAIAPGSSADFSFSTTTDVQTTNTFSCGTSPEPNNWSWWNGVAGGGGEGNSVLPVPALAP